MQGEACQTFIGSGDFSAMIVEIINTGSELMLGRVLNTHQQWLCQQFANLGYVVSRQVGVADTANDIQMAVREALARADLVVTTGGLGPTSDDITRDLIAQLLGRKLVRDEEVAARITGYFVGRKRPMPQSVLVQAMVPEGATVLPNANGTAPGLAMAVDKKWLVMLPGPPRELRPMFLESVVPLVKREFDASEIFVCRTLRSFGMGESMVEEKVAEKLKVSVSSGMELGYCARPGQVDVRLAMRGSGAEKIVAAAEEIVRGELGQHIYGLDDDTLESVVVRTLVERKRTVAVAESCTGGCIANTITNVPGASEIFPGGFVTYSNVMKEKFLGVGHELLEEHGAVSEPVAREMAEGVRRVTGADFAVAVTGIAGPGGGSPAKPVGTVFIALAAAEGTQVWKMNNAFDRETFKEITAQQALNLLRLRLAK